MADIQIAVKSRLGAINLHTATEETFLREGVREALLEAANAVLRAHDIDQILDADRVAAEVMAEESAQNEKWGQQNHLDGTGPEAQPLNLSDSGFAPYSTEWAAELARDFRRSTKARFREKGSEFEIGEASTASHGAWSDILLEEVFEALAEEDPAKLRTELIQVAAVAQQWVRSIDRRGGTA